MPLYLCQAGLGYGDSWRQGVQVYATPIVLSQAPQQQQQHNNIENSLASSVSHSSNPATTSALPLPQPTQASIRRVRHAEVVLVDDICLFHGHYWLRLRWPGQKGGFAGYIAIQDLISPSSPRPPLSSSSYLPIMTTTYSNSRTTAVLLEQEDRQEATEGFDSFPTHETRATIPSSSKGQVSGASEAEDDSSDIVVPTENRSTDDTIVVSCIRTGLPFLSSRAMRLLPMYDDGISPQVAAFTATTTTSNAATATTKTAFNTINNAMEPVFCRICREGLHDDADDEQPTPAVAENDAEEAHNGGSDIITTSRQSSLNIDDLQELHDLSAERNSNQNQETETPVGGVYQQPSTLLIQGPVFPNPHYSPNHHALENPLLAPCECSGSMAFVHYLCVEQWRCRSRHPEAQNGLNCETCGSPYSLPPPTSRPVTQAMMMEPQAAEDWLDAMPPHVMQALRQPHILWQIGAAVVRRRWLRPLAPIFMSPIVALYCRARRLLKKRGVARRRWACSLCRRRARWKCVRCLRSYYCSRQCQNVSWHIVHKHVCYKPARLWWSTVVYGGLCFLAFPGIVRDPLMYDLGLFLFPFSFIAIGIVAGGIATLLKKSLGLDLRGRLLELTVVVGTLWLTTVSWGLVQGFFGHASACRGTGGRSLIVHNLKQDAPAMLLWIQKLLLYPAQSYYLMWDRLALQSGPWLSSILCLQEQQQTANGGGCFEYLPFADASFFSQKNPEVDETTAKCAADLVLVGYIYAAALVSYCGSALYKQHERRQRRQPRRHHHHRNEAGVARPHQD